MWPGSHRAAFHDELGERGPSVLRERPSVRMTLGAGDAALMDSRLWHCGGANDDDAGRSRCLLVLTFAAPGAEPEGSTYSMLPAAVGKHTLRSIRAQH